MVEANFSMIGYKFTNVELDLTGDVSKELKLSLDPKGCFHSEKGEFELSFDFYAQSSKENTQKNVLHVTCKALFRFANVHEIDNIPDYFYANRIDIVFPYVRAFISTVTLQANVAPIVIPTLNLSALRDTLVSNTAVAK